MENKEKRTKGFKGVVFKLKLPIFRYGFQSTC